MLSVCLPIRCLLFRFPTSQILLLPVCVGADLVLAWGKGGPWTEESGSVFAPEEVRTVPSAHELHKTR
jgi:hypothetical protein